MQGKLKSLIADDAVFMAVLLFLVAVASFGLGRQSVVSSPGVGQGAGVVLYAEPDQAAGARPAHPLPAPERAVQESQSAVVVASKSGSKYHRLDCPGASQIKDTNKIYFTSIDEAQAAGYTPAANCPGL